MSVKKRFVVLFLLALGTLVLSGCVGTSNTGASPTPASTATPTALPVSHGAGNVSLTYPIVGTGQTLFYNNVRSNSDSNTVIASPSTGQAFYGEDAQYARSQPAYKYNGDGTITDLNTGLMWVAARGDKVTWDAAVTGAANCTVGGYHDWRMPTIKELYSLINSSGKLGDTDATSTPYIDTRYFQITFGDATGGRVIDGQDWSATKYVGTTMNDAVTIFGVNFIDGRIKGYPYVDPNPQSNEMHTLYVRYVRGNPAYGVNNFVDNGNGTITDKATGLTWSQNDSGTGMDWQDALAWVQTQNAADYLGHNDWRLPTAKELQSIVDYNRSPDTTNSAAIDPVFHCTSITNEGGAADYPYFWTSTTLTQSNEGIYIAFGRALGWMKMPGKNYYTLMDVHGAGAQRSDTKSGSVTSYLLGNDANGKSVYGRGPQGDVVRIDNYVRLV